MTNFSNFINFLTSFIGIENYIKVSTLHGDMLYEVHAVELAEGEPEALTTEPNEWFKPEESVILNGAGGLDIIIPDYVHSEIVKGY